MPHQKACTAKFIWSSAIGQRDTYDLATRTKYPSEIFVTSFLKALASFGTPNRHPELTSTGLWYGVGTPYAGAHGVKRGETNNRGITCVVVISGVLC